MVWEALNDFLKYLSPLTVKGAKVNEGHNLDIWFFMLALPRSAPLERGLHEGCSGKQRQFKEDHEG